MRRFRATRGRVVVAMLLAGVLAPGTVSADATDGDWGPVIAWPHVPVSAANLPDGRILTWSGSERRHWPTTEQTYSATWNPATGEFIELFHDTHNMFCAHLSLTENGEVFVNGGRNQTNSPWTSLFDFRNDEWVQIDPMDLMVGDEISALAEKLSETEYEAALIRRRMPDVTVPPMPGPITTPGG